MTSCLIMNIYRPSNILSHSTTMKDMDDVFKLTYDMYAFSRMGMLEPNWKLQIIRMNDIWEDIRQCFTEDCFRDSFIKFCAQDNLPGETYDSKKGYERANNEWREELMLIVADRTIKLYDDDVPLSAAVVTWDNNKNSLLVDRSICKLFYDKE